MSERKRELRTEQLRAREQQERGAGVRVLKKSEELVRQVGR